MVGARLGLGRVTIIILGGLGRVNARVGLGRGNFRVGKGQVGLKSKLGWGRDGKETKRVGEAHAT